MTTALITSAAYVSPEIAAEVGLLPPAFLPVANSRLFLHQIRELGTWVDRCVMTVPESYVVPEYDRQAIDASKLEILRVPDGLSLGDSVSFAILSALQSDGEIVILHGDTLIRELGPARSEGFSVHDVSHPYPWAVWDRAEQKLISVDLAKSTYDSRPILSGLFRFKSSLQFLRCLAKARGRFVDAINLYALDAPGFGPWYNIGEWLDFGHLNLFFRSRKRLTTERAFNRLKIDDLTVTKVSSDAHKMDAEAYWFENLPPRLRIHCPAYLGRTIGQPGYEIEYEALCPLSDLYVFGSLPAATWHRIFIACATFLRLCAAEVSAKEANSGRSIFHSLLIEKTSERLRRYPERLAQLARSEVNLNGAMVPGTVQILNEAISQLGKISDVKPTTLMHGDFCFSNILYDARRETVKVIDPRGHLRDTDRTLSGTSLYDLAKLHHSVHGLYDFIIAGYFQLDIRVGTVPEITFKVGTPQSFSDIAAAYQKEFHSACSHAALDWMTVLLFLAMVPLHYDHPERQIALFVNALRIYQGIAK